MTSIIQALYDWFERCPILKDGYLNVERLGADPVEYTIDADQPADPIIKRYTDGDTIRQFPFIFASREEYGCETAKNIANSSFYEELSEWVEKQAADKNFPILDEGKNVQDIRVTSVGCPFSVTENTARYQILMNLIYYQEVI
ncbi:MAG: chloramphenicol resistance protein [Ruminococcus sp.]|nr:chloramphenicol resistance protein [Ruminococcus sp.]